MDQMEQVLHTYGLSPEPRQVDAIRRLLVEECANTERENHEYMRLLCTQLFSIGQIEDTRLIWQAKRLSMDSFFMMDVQLLCGAGLEATQLYLLEMDEEEAVAELAYLEKCEAAGDFEEFSKEVWMKQAKLYYV